MEKEPMKQARMQEKASSQKPPCFTNYWKLYIYEMGNYISFTETPKNLQKTSRTKSIIWTFEDFTEDAPEDDKIKRGVTGLQQGIFQHAQIFYRREEVRYTPTDIEEILKKDSQIHPNFSTSEFAHLLCDLRSRRSAICSYVSYMVTKNLEFSGSQSNTLLVPSILECMAELEIGDPQVKLSEEDEWAFAQWRAVTAHFLSKKGQNAERIKEEKAERIDQLIYKINNILVHFALPDDDESSRLKSLRRIVTKGEVVGQMMFASPSRWLFDWKPDRQVHADNVRDGDGAPRKLQRSHEFQRRESDAQNRKLQRSNESQRGRKRRSRRKSRVIVLFPGLDQRFTQDGDDNKQAFDTNRSPGSYDHSEEVRDAIRDIRRLGIANGGPGTSEGFMSESSLGTVITQDPRT